MSGVTSATPLMAAASLALGVVGTGMSMYGMAQQASAQQDSMNYQAQIANNNAIIAKQNADTATAQGEAQVQANQRKTASLVGAQRAALSANGIDANSGSALDVQSSASEMGQLDDLTIRYNAQQTARNYLIQGAGYTAQAGLDQMGAANAGAAGTVGMTSSLLGGAASATDKWVTYQNNGTLTSRSPSISY